jgi:predicted deacylase
MSAATQKASQYFFCLRLTAIFAALFFFTSNLFALDFDRYHTQEEISSYMRAMASDQPDLVRYNLLGYSQEGRDIAYVTIGKHSGHGNRPALYLNGTHHGNEKSSTEGILGLIDYLIINKDNQAVSDLLENYTIYLQPLVNPDGHAYNIRENVDGFDPNRDYGFPGIPDEKAFKTSPVKLVKQLVDRIKPRAAAAYHSGMEGVLWPLCFTPKHSRDHDLYYTLAKSSAEAMGMKRYAQSFYDYPSKGEFIDYVYLAHNTLALTFEVSSQGNPPESQLLSVVQRSIIGAMTFMTDILAIDRNQFAIATAPQQRKRPNIFLSQQESLPLSRH